MKINVKKILNKTDLAQSGSHGGLVVTKSNQKALINFFEKTKTEQTFTDRSDNQKYLIHYQDYTSNGKTPNDRITPIGKYAKKHKLQPGDILSMDRIDTAGESVYFIEYIRPADSVFFEGKSKTRVEALNSEQLTKLLAFPNAAIKKLSANEFEMSVTYLEQSGQLRLLQNENSCELYFNNQPIGGNKTYFELDTSKTPFILTKTETWMFSMEIDADTDIDKSDEEANRAADAALISELADIEEQTTQFVYNPAPGKKAARRESRGRQVPARSKIKAENALKRAEYKCEADKEHKTFLRKKSLLPYTEPHHLIPLKFDNLFEYSLDVEANIVSLCSNCHNQIHYGESIEPIIRKLWNQRKDELGKAGLLVMKNGVPLTIDILLEFYGVH